MRNSLPLLHFYIYVLAYLLLNNCMNMGVRYVLKMPLEFPVPLWFSWWGFTYAVSFRNISGLILLEINYLWEVLYSQRMDLFLRYLGCSECEASAQGGLFGRRSGTGRSTGCSPRVWDWLFSVVSNTGNFGSKFDSYI